MGGIHEKFREVISKCDCRYLFGRWDARSNGAEPRAEIGEYQFGKYCREVLQESLSDQTGLNIPMVGVDFSANSVAIVRGLLVEILVP